MTTSAATLPSAIDLKRASAEETDPAWRNSRDSISRKRDLLFCVSFSLPDMSYGGVGGGGGGGRDKKEERKE